VPVNRTDGGIAMYEERLSELEIISRTVGASPAYVQGGGGNTSVKLDDELMAVKASGFALTQVTAQSGFVVVNYKKINEHYDSMGESPGEDFEKKMNEVIQASIVDLPGIERLRPSVEAGFHSLLDRYVIHTHSVYANILCCSKEGESIARKLFEGKLPLLWLPYVNPGFGLSMKIKEEMKNLPNGVKYPSAVFMQNHGLIITAGCMRECLELHEKVNNEIKSYFNIKEPFPEICLEKISESEYESRTENVVDFFENSGYGFEYLNKYILYPDQLVYLNSSIFGEGEAKVKLHDGKVIYNTNLKTARILDETLSAYLYVTSNVMGRGLTLTTMTDEQINFITNWDSEKYRKRIAEKQD